MLVSNIEEFALLLECPSGKTLDTFRTARYIFGPGYNSHIGAYVCPESGLYKFSATNLQETTSEDATVIVLTFMFLRNSPRLKHNIVEIDKG